MLTIIGPGGTGKTRFSIELARFPAEEADGGTVFVPLAPVRAAALVVPLIAERLNRGSLVNLAAGLGTAAPQLFDPFAAIMLLGLDAILTGRIADLPAGVQRYPTQLETRVARALIDSTCD